MSHSLSINSIYRATEGEGIHVGRPQIFVRVQGCHVGCLNCDSMETWDFVHGLSQEVGSIAQQVVRLGGDHIRWVSVTGGDPLHPRHVPGVGELLRQLQGRGYRINIEAAGTRIVHDIFRPVDFISFDYKPPSTGVKFCVENLFKLCREYPGKFQLKSVVADAKDFHACLDTYGQLQARGLGQGFEWCLTPAYSPGEAFNPQRFIEVMELNYRHHGGFRVIGQQHKWLYGPERKQV